MNLFENARRILGESVEEIPEAVSKEGTEEVVIEKVEDIDVSKEEFYKEEMTESARPYGYHPKNPKIDIYYNGKYAGSTNWSSNLKMAKEKYIEQNKEVDPEKVKAVFYNRNEN
jgi:hypothetical protein